MRSVNRANFGITSLGLILICLLCGGCSAKKEAALPPSPTDQYVESVNAVSGSFGVSETLSEDKQAFTISPTQAYARVVRNLDDQNKKDALIILVEKPLPRFALAFSKDEAAADVERYVSGVLRNRNARGVAFRVPMDQQDSNPDVLAYFSGTEAHLGNLVVQVKSKSADKVEGQIKGDVASQPGDINFSVSLRPDVWTGGTYYQQPPTNLSPGQASGQIGMNEETVKFNHAYARLVEFDMFDENKNAYKVWLTEKPVDEKALDADLPKELLAMKQSGNNLVMSFSTTGPDDRSDPDLLLLADFREGMNENQLSRVFQRIPGIECDYVRHNQNAIEGRLFLALPIREGRESYALDLLFNAAMLPPAVTDGPVTAGNGGTPLPDGGGDPAKAYMAAVERMKSAKDFDQKLEVWLSVIPTAEAQKLAKDLETATPQARQLLLEVFAPLEELQLIAGFIKDDRATLRLTGIGREARASEVVNMHLENGQWKIGRREIREE